MIVIAMLHRVSDTNLATWPQCQYWLTQMSERYPIISPGDTQQPGVNVCLTFDDAYVDFYHHVFPLLQHLNITATLAVPTAYILDSTDTPMAARLAIPEKQALQDGHWQRGSLCTWPELKVMADSGLVKLASHGHSHQGLADPHYDVVTEQQHAKQLIIDKTGHTPHSYIYPYGGFTIDNHRRAKQHYHYLLRIGGASNRDWYPSNDLLYRFDAEPFWRKNKLPSPWQFIKWWLKHWQNQWRGR